MSSRILASLAFASVLVVAGCSMTVEAVNPRPNVVVPAGSPRYSVDVSHVHDHVEMERVTINQFRTTLARGFANAVGSKLSKPDAHDSVVLVLDNVDPELSNLGSLGRFVTLRFRGKWMTPDNRVIAEFAGVAQPRNPTETGTRHLEDVVEVMYEKIIGGLEQTLRDSRDSARPEPPSAQAPMKSTKL